MPYYEYVFVVLLFIAISAILAFSYGLQNIGVSLVLCLVGLLMVAIRKENAWK